MNQADTSHDHFLLPSICRETQLNVDTLVALRSSLTDACQYRGLTSQAVTHLRLWLLRYWRLAYFAPGFRRFRAAHEWSGGDVVGVGWVRVHAEHQRSALAWVGLLWAESADSETSIARSA